MPPSTAIFTSSPSLPHLQDGTTRYPELGIMATTIGTLLAVALIPEDPQPAGALFRSALAMTAGLAAAPAAAAFKDPKSLLRGEHLLALSPVYWLLLDLLQGVYPMNSIETEQVRIAFIGIGVFVTAVWIAALQMPWTVLPTVVHSASVDLSASTYFCLSLLTFVLGMLPFAVPCHFNIVEMFSYLGQGRWDAPWGRGQLGGWDAFLDHLQYFGYLLPALTVIMARRAGWANLRTLSSMGMTLVMLLFLAQSGSRRIIGVIFGMGLILWMLTQQRLKTKHMIAVAVAAVALLAFMQLMLDYRGVGLGAVLQKDRMKTVHRQEYLRVDDNIFRFSQIIQLVPESHPYVYHRYLIWVLVRPIPRVFWPGKPVDPGFDLPATLGMKGLSLSFSTIGELYLSGGLVAIALGGWLYGRLSGMASGLLTQGSTFGAYVIYSTLMMALFSGMRSMLELVLTSYVVLAWMGLLRFVGLFQRLANVPAQDPFCTTNPAPRY